ncbi:hypothetical protein J2W91_002814 [Paenibacillus amylolyticus]|uniref:Uncharacterized protein n=1 Tax=Paenibacillus amylolyticus TaxID=1451 RepID=A0AAP5H3K7_PAEAM|nr:hypothetical protein [Paenibacillus amylolyticus]MDR6724346.1 hypothetical protein [Paenibacillus amylolyticus]
MAKPNTIRLKAERYKDRPVCVTLHNGETYIGYIRDVKHEGVVIAGGGKISNTESSGGKPHSSKRSKGNRSHGTGVRSNNRRKRVNGTRKASNHTRTASHAQVSSFMPMMGSLLGGLGGASSAGGMLGGGMRLFGMIQRFVPVVKMGYGMIKSIQPFMGAVQGLMVPQQANPPEAETEEE